MSDHTVTEPAPPKPAWWVFPAIPAVWCRRLRWIPNFVTVFRLAGMPVLLYVLLTEPGPTTLIGGLLFGLLAGSDFVDGKAARLLHAESAFGRLADPLADRLLMMFGLIGLVALGRFAWPGPVIVIVRDALAIVAFAWLARRRGVVMRVDWPGKLSSALAMFGVFFGILIDQLWVDILFWAAVVFSVATFVHYAWKARRIARTVHQAATAEA